MPLFFLPSFKTTTFLPIEFLAKQYKKKKEDEIERIKSLNVLFINSFTEKFLPDITYLHGLELAHILMANNYYVFTHGQNIKTAFITDLITHAWKTTQGPSEHFHRYWRLPGRAIDFDNVRQFRASKIKKNSDHKNRYHMLSVDGLLSRTEQAESAWSYYVDAMNWWGQSKEIRPIALAIAEFWLENADKASQRKLARKIIFAIKNLGNFGRINLIAIPSELLKNEATCFVYSSHQFGYECDCVEQNHTQFIATLEKHQRGQYDRCCKPQYRILSHPLDMHSEVLTFSFDDTSDYRKQAYQNTLQSIIDLAAQLKFSGPLLNQECQERGNEDEWSDDFIPNMSQKSVMI